MTPALSHGSIGRPRHTRPPTSKFTPPTSKFTPQHSVQNDNFTSPSYHGLWPSPAPQNRVAGHPHFATIPPCQNATTGDPQNCHHGQPENGHFFKQMNTNLSICSEKQFRQFHLNTCHRCTNAHTSILNTYNCSILHLLLFTYPLSLTTLSTLLHIFKIYGEKIHMM